MRPIIILVVLLSCVFSADITKNPTDSPLYHHSSTAPVKLTCTYTGSNTVTARTWTNSVGTDEDELTEEHSNWNSGTNAYTFTWADPTKCPEAIYTCSISLNTGGKESATFDLKIKFVKLLQSDINAIAGDAATLTCSVITAKSTVLKWKRWDDSLLVASNSTSWNSGTNNRTSYLSFSSVAVTDAGTWRCQISDTEYSTTNTTLGVIAVTMVPVITTSPYYSHVNSKLQLIVSVTGSMTVSAKTWTNSIGTDEDTLNDVYASYNAGTKTTTLTIPNATSNYDASYTCAISFSNGYKVTKVFNDIKISLVTMGQNDTISDSSTEALFCSVVTGNNTVLKWINHSNGSVIAGTSSYNSSTSTLTSVLTVSSFGVYACKISETENSVTNTTIHFIAITGTNATVKLYTDASIKCDVKIIGADWLKKSTLIWKEDGKVISSGAGLNITTDDVTNSVVSSTLALANVSTDRIFSCGAQLNSQWYGAILGVKVSTEKKTSKTQYIEKDVAGSIICNISTEGSNDVGNIAWKKDGAATSYTSSSPSVSNNYLTSSLTIPSGGDGMYSCEVTIAGNKNIQSITVLSWKISKTPSSEPYYSHNNDALNLTCVYSGSLASISKVSWVVSDGVNVSGKHTFNSNTNTTVLSLDTSSVKTAVKYTCSFVYSGGEISKIFTGVQVQLITMGQNNQLLVLKDSKVTLACSVVTSSTNTLLKLMKGEKEVTASRSDYTNSRLTKYLDLSSAQPSSSGVYTCQISKDEISTTNTTLYVVEISYMSETIKKGSKGILACTLTVDSSTNLDNFNSSWSSEGKANNVTQVTKQPMLNTTLGITDDITYTCTFFLKSYPTVKIEKQLMHSVFEVVTSAVLNSTKTGLDFYCNLTSSTPTTLLQAITMMWRTSNNTNITLSTPKIINSVIVSSLTLVDNRYGNGSYYCVVQVKDREFLTELIYNVTELNMLSGVGQLSRSSLIIYVLMWILLHII